MANIYLKPKQKIAIYDIDGTLTDNSLLIPYPTNNERKDRNKFYKSVAYYNHDIAENIVPIKEMVYLARTLDTHGIIPIFLTAREDCCNGLIRENTKAFIEEIFGTIEDGQLLMREENDLRPNYEIKKELYETYIKDKFDVFCAFDDEPNNVAMFQEEGILTLQPHYKLDIDK